MQLGALQESICTVDWRKKRKCCQFRHFCRLHWSHLLLRFFLALYHIGNRGSLTLMWRVTLVSVLCIRLLSSPMASLSTWSWTMVVISQTWCTRNTPSTWRASKGCQRRRQQVCTTCTAWWQLASSRFLPSMSTTLSQRLAGWKTCPGMVYYWLLADTENLFSAVIYV